MDADGINEVLREVFGNVPTKIINGWVSIRCPLAPWTHESGKDSSASAGVSINNHGTSIFNCLDGRTQVMTRGGLKLISSLAGTSPELLMPDGSWRVAPVRSFGFQELRQITLSRNARTMTVFATPNHRWFAKTASSNPYVERTTDELRPGYQMQSAFSAQKRDWALDPIGVLHGLVFGDGTRQTGTRFGSVCLYGVCRELCGYLSQIPGLRITQHYGEDGSENTQNYVRVHGSIGYMKDLPDIGSSDAYILGFLSGLIAADGHVDARGNVSLASASLLALKRVNDLCVRVGIAVSGISCQMRSGFGRPAAALYTMRFFRHAIDCEFFSRSDQRHRFASAPAREYERTCWRVKRVESTSLVREVFCAEVPEFHAFTLAGNLLTGNCYTCKTKGPLHYMIKRYGEYTGEDFGDLIDELEDEAYLGARTLPEWGSLFTQNDELVALKPAVYMGLYDSAANHPYVVNRGISVETVERLNLMLEPSDPSDGEERILFPVFGPNGDLYGFSGRATSKHARLKVRDYYGLKKAKCLLGSHLITVTKPDKILVVEGLFDYANAWECGFPAVAVMHSTMTEAQAEILRNFALPVYLFYDNDAAGQKGVEIAGELLSRYVPTMKVRYMEDETGFTPKDPGELHAAEFQAMLDDARMY